MKRMLVAAVALLCLVMMMGAAGFRTIPGWLDSSRNHKCLGYTIIAYDLGINCHGDTIRLVRKNGFAEKARHR